MMNFIFAFILCLTSLPASAGIQVALTVDDLPMTGDVPLSESQTAILDKFMTAFKTHQISGVYGFVNAQRMSQDPAGRLILSNWTGAGNFLGNHTFSHKNIDESTLSEFKSDILKNEPILREFGRQSNWHFFRFPYLREGNTAEKRKDIRNFLDSKGYQIAEVTIDFNDWDWNAPYARCKNKGDSSAVAKLKASYLLSAIAQLNFADSILTKLFKRPVPQVLLLHIGAFDAEMIADLIESFQKAGVEFIALPVAEMDAVYQIDPGVPFDAGAELTYQILKSRNMKLKDIGMAIPDQPPLDELEKYCR